MGRHADVEREWRTRKSRIDPKLDGLGWRLRPEAPGGPFRSEEFETDAGPADYVLHVNGHVVGVIEAKKLTVGPQNVLTQAERYARGIRESPYDFDGPRAPFLYSTRARSSRSVFVPYHLTTFSSFVPDRVSAHQESTELPVEPPQPALELEGLPGLARLLEGVQQAREIVSVDRVLPTPAQGSGCRKAGVVQPALIEGLGGSVRSGRASQGRD